LLLIDFVIPALAPAIEVKLVIHLGGNNNQVLVVPQQTARRGEDSNPTEEARELRALYDKHMEDMGVTQGKDTERYVLRNYVYDTIWSLKKFVAGDHEMEATGCIATLVFEGVNVDTLDRPEYWKKIEVI
jgi:hypothetical protein